MRIDEQHVRPVVCHGDIEHPIIVVLKLFAIDVVNDDLVVQHAFVLRRMRKAEFLDEIIVFNKNSLLLHHLVAEHEPDLGLLARGPRCHDRAIDTNFITEENRLG